MTRPPAQSAAHPLGLHEGRCMLSSAQAILKATFECERDVTLLIGPRHESFSEIFSALNDDAVGQVLRQHGLSLLPVPHARRGITLALQAAHAGHAAVVLVPNSQLDACIEPLAMCLNAPLGHGGALCILIEDDPAHVPYTCPRQTAIRLGLACLEPGDVGAMRDQIDMGLRLSRVGALPVALSIHSNVWRSSQTLEMRPNRVLGPVDVVLARRRRKPRWTETRDIMRMARRMELNVARAIPNPGERVPVGFITVGPADPAVAYVAEALHLHGRLPVLQLGLLHPIDETAVGRLLNRCEHVVVLEPRPATGAIEHAVLEVAERMRQLGEQSSHVWGRQLPPSTDGVERLMENNEAVHPSVLSRKVVHLLHALRPTLQVATHLVPDPPPPTLQVPLRGTEIGTSAAVALLRRVVTDVDQWLRGQSAQLKEQGLEPTALAMDGLDPPTHAGATRLVPVEFWAGRTFVDAGLAAVRQAARDTRPWIMFVCDIDVPDNLDIERLARGTVPGERAERVSIQTASLSDRAQLRELLESAVVQPQLTIIIVRDGSPPRYDINALERSLAEVDRFGFQPHQRLVRPANQACMFARPSDDDGTDEESTAERKVRTEVTVDRAARKGSGSRVRIKVRPLLEQIEVIRTKPPAWIWRSALSETQARLDLPTPIHRTRPVWRVHIAGYRGSSFGVAPFVLQEAGRNMGYDVAAVHDPTPIGTGRRAWSQVVFTRPRTESPPMNQHRVMATAPYGEVDLLVGLDVQETIRAISPEETLRVGQRERTSLVANTGSFSDLPGTEERELSPAMRAEYIASLDAVTMQDHRVIEDIASACRVWFHTDRVTDIAMLGVAFQGGLIPVNLEAIEQAVARAEAHGFGRSSEAFEFGRHLAVNAKLLTKPRTEREDDYENMIRRMALGLRGSKWRGMKYAQRFEGTVRRALEAMPGLGETASGRQAQRDFVTAVYRALEWGGFDYAARYADLITALYQADRGETGRSLTRHAVLPLAEAMLVHDPIYIASMATSPEQRRQLKQRLNIKHARGDSIERRYLTRLELVVLNQRFRADVRSSDWPARVARAMRHVVPSNWRGTRREREIRSYIMDCVQRATHESHQNYVRWSDGMQHLFQVADSNRLRDMALSEIKMLIEPTVAVSVGARPQ